MPGWPRAGCATSLCDGVHTRVGHGSYDPAITPLLAGRDACSSVAVDALVSRIEGMETIMQKDMITHEAYDLIATDRVEGTPVRSTEGIDIGTIKRLMIDKLTGNVAYA